MTQTEHANPFHAFAAHFGLPEDSPNIVVESADGTTTFLISIISIPPKVSMQTMMRQQKDTPMPELRWGLREGGDQPVVYCTDSDLFVNAKDWADVNAQLRKQERVLPESYHDLLGQVAGEPGLARKFRLHAKAHT